MPDNNKIKKPLRSAQWFGQRDKNGFMYRSWMRNQGIPEHHFQGRPIIGICNTWSELTPCNAHFRELADRVRRGVLEAGGVPVEFPVFSNGESNLRPTAMLTRNLASMDVEESIRGNPIDGVVLLVGCDKTTPALLMGAASCDLPTIVVTGGPMLNGKHKGMDVGSGTHVWRMSEDYKAGLISLQEFMDAEADMSRSAGTCNTMGTRLHHGLYGGSHGRLPATQCRDSGGRCATQCPGFRFRYAHCGDGCRRPQTIATADPRGFYQCHSGQCSYWRLD
jgi:dihydroxy-acid dehydratase/L-arabonate dehydrase